MELEEKVNQVNEKTSIVRRAKEYIDGCLDPESSRVYGTFQERAALNITQFPKIQASLLIRMGLVYPIASYLIDKAGLSIDSQSEFFGLAVNYHTWAAGYLAYLTEIQLGLSKYPMEFLSKGIKKTKDYLSRED